MLVLTRKRKESVLIGDDIEITILEIEGDRVKLGIRAPKDRTILRGELVAETVAINMESANTSVEDLKKLKSYLAVKK